MRRLLAVTPSLLLFAVVCLLIVPGVRTASAHPADGIRTGKRCDTCHLSMSSKYLNSVGLYYKRKNTLVGAPLEQLQREQRNRRSNAVYKPKYQPGRSSSPEARRR